MNLELLPIDISAPRSDKIFAAAECQEIFNVYEKYYFEIGYNLPWIGYFIVENDEVVGVCGFTGLPKNGMVEIAYHVFDQNKGRGVATKAAGKLINIAQTNDATLLIIAKTAPFHSASTRILEKNQFNYSGIIQDIEIGEAWLWKFEIVK